MVFTKCSLCVWHQTQNLCLKSLQVFRTKLGIDVFYSRRKSQFGAYITNEYEVLLKVFSYLPSKSLISASRVCKEWKNVAGRILIKRNRPIGHCRTFKKKWTKDCFNEYIQPKILLHFTSSYGARNSGSELYSMMSIIYDAENVKVYNIRNGYFIASEYSACKLDINSKLGKNDQAYLALCDMPGVSINSFFLHSNAPKQELEDQILTISPSQPKCVIIITGGTSLKASHLSTISKFSPILVAGGMAENSIKLRPLKKGGIIDRTCLCITFDGENVSPYVALHELNHDLEKFMKKLSKDTGPIPHGGLRIAFVFSCINRLEQLEDEEANLFSKYFPDVPLYGLWSYGEYMTALNKIMSPREIRRHQWDHIECSSYLILTFKREV